MKRRNLRIGILTTTILTYISNVAAQEGGPIEVGGQSYDSLLDFFINFYGIPTSGGFSLETLGYVGGFVVFDLVFYYGLLAAIRRSNSKSLAGAVGISPRDNAGFEFSRSLFVLSTAALVSVFTFGGALQGGIAGLAGVMMIGIGGLIVVLFLYIIAGVFSAGAGGAQVIAGAGHRGMDALEDVARLEQRIDAVRQEDQAGQTDQAVNDLEDIIEELVNTGESIDQLLQTDTSDLNQALQDLEQEVNIAKEDLELTHEVEDLDRLVVQNLDQIYQERNSGSISKSELDSKLQDTHNALQELENDLNKIGNDEVSSRQDMREDLKVVVREADEVAHSLQIIRDLKKVVEESEAEWSHLHEELPNDGRLQTERSQLEDLEQFINNELRPMEQEAAQLVERAVEIVEERMTIEREEAKELVELVETNGKIHNKWNKINDDDVLQDYGVSTGDPEEAEFHRILNVFSDVNSKIDRIEQYDNEELDMEKQALNALRESLQALQN